MKGIHSYLTLQGKRKNSLTLEPLVLQTLGRNIGENFRELLLSPSNEKRFSKIHYPGQAGWVFVKYMATHQ